jgi:hypothetical protein
MRYHEYNGTGSWLVALAVSMLYIISYLVLFVASKVAFIRKRLPLAGSGPRCAIRLCTDLTVVACALVPWHRLSASCTHGCLHVTRGCSHALSSDCTSIWTPACSRETMENGFFKIKVFALSDTSDGSEPVRVIASVQVCVPAPRRGRCSHPMVSTASLHCSTRYQG